MLSRNGGGAAALTPTSSVTAGVEPASSSATPSANRSGVSRLTSAAPVGRPLPTSNAVAAQRNSMSCATTLDAPNRYANENAKAKASALRCCAKCRRCAWRDEAKLT